MAHKQSPSMARSENVAHLLNTAGMSIGFLCQKKQRSATEEHLNSTHGEAKVGMGLLHSQELSKQACWRADSYCRVFVDSAL